MHKIKYKAFNLIEVMIVVGLVSIVLAIVGPSFTKRIKNSENSNCVGGLRTVKKVFMAKYDNSESQAFSVPDNVSGSLVITVIGAGGAGADGSSVKQNPVTGTGSCTLSSTEGNNYFRRNVNFQAVGAGTSASCSSPSAQAGSSGAYFYAYNIPVGKTDSLTFSYSGGEWSESGNIATLTKRDAVSGDVGQNASPTYLQGGIPQGTVTPNTGSLNLGVGQSCIWLIPDERYVPISSLTSQGCYISHELATPGKGGGAGGFARFNLSAAGGSTCTITVGKGGISGQDSGNGGSTSITCLSTATSYTAGGGIGGYAGGTGGSASGGQNGGDGESASGVSGGQGGSVTGRNQNQDIIFSAKGGQGGCHDTLNPSECQNPNGDSGTSPISDLTQAGAGGGGGSCNEGSCGVGGRGGDGLVIIEYKTKCY